MKDIGETIRYYREETGLTQKELASKLQLSASTIGMYEQNRRTPDLSTIQELASIFNISVDKLLNHQTQLPLLGDADDKDYRSNHLIPIEKKLLESFRLLNEDNKDIIIGEVKKLLKEQRYDNSVAESHKQAK